MSHRERHASASTTATVAEPVPQKNGPKPNPSAAALRSASCAEAAPASVTPWDLLCRSASPAQHADLLALASRQGLLYTPQLPPLPVASRASAPADEPHTWNLLGKILAGQVQHLEPVRPAVVATSDTALDEAQRRAVAAALATPDICLIQGGPGTGKSRVLAEIVTQATARGDRVLLVAAHAAGIDRVLEQVGSRDALCALRCLAPDETAAQLPPLIRALTLVNKAATLRQQSLTSARAARLAAEMQCARRRHEGGLWAQFEELVEALSAARAALAQAEAQVAAVPDQVAREVETGDGACPVARDVKALRQGCDQRQQQFRADISATEQVREHNRTQVAALEPRITSLEPLAAARRRGNWWSPIWWKARFKGDVLGRLRQLQTQRQEFHDGILVAERRLQELSETQRTSAEQAEASVRARIQAEIDKRQKKLGAVAGEAQSKVRRLESRWDDLRQQLDSATPRPEQNLASVQAAREQWQRQRHDDEARSGLAREWVEYLESSNEALAARLPGFANLVAATPAALAADPNFGDAAASGGIFDLLLLDEADQLSESDFLKVARRARHWVLVGEPAVIDGHRSSTAGRGHNFHKLWEYLHCDPSSLPYAWFREGDRLGCRLRQLPAEQRQRLEKEPLADVPDLELRILALPRLRPVLAEVVFPASMALPAAKEFLFRELQEITVQTLGRAVHWCETPERIGVHFGPTPAETQAVPLDNGVREYLTTSTAGASCRTCRLEFDIAAGWDRAAVERWLEDRLRLRDLGRTAWLDTPHRMTAALATVLGDLLGHGGTASIAATEPVVEFVAVLGKGKPPRRDHRGNRTGEAAPSGLPATGAGLEIDLSAPRQGDRLPSEVRGQLPARGFVNLPEARAVIRKLEELLLKPGLGNGHAPQIAVVALYPAQAELIRHFLRRSPVLAAHAAAIEVGPPAQFRHREADVVLVSMTRSHSHRAVAYGEGPAAILQAWTRARHRLVLLGDPGNLIRRSHWRGVLDHLDEAAAGREAHILGQLVRYLQGHGHHATAFRLSESHTS
jgi:hypothetical protein